MKTKQSPYTKSYEALSPGVIEVCYEGTDGSWKAAGRGRTNDEASAAAFEEMLKVAPKWISDRIDSDRQTREAARDRHDEANEMRRYGL